MTAGRYTVIFTGLLRDRNAGEYTYLGLSEISNNSESGTLHQGRPPCERLKREISFHDLPEHAREAVLDEYAKLWNIYGG